MPNFIFLLIMLAGILDPPVADAQPKQLRYHLFSKNEKIGEIVATRAVSGNETVYMASTSMTVKIVMKQDVAYQVRSVFRNGLLSASAGQTFLNKKMHGTCTAQWKNNRYTIRKDDDPMPEIGRHISYAGAMLYFHEPPALGMVFSELNGYENKIRRTAAHQYTLTDAKSKKENRYYYRNGILEQAFIEHTMMSIEVRRVDD